MGTRDGVRIFDITQPANPEQIGHILGAYVSQVSVDAGILFQVVNYHLLTVPAHGQINLSGVFDNPTDSPDQVDPRSLSISLYPNPFNPRVKASFYLNKTGDVSMRVFDIRGRLVQVLHEGVLEQGDHSLIWDGRDQTGRELPSGTYFFQIKTSTESKSQRGLLLR